MSKIGKRYKRTDELPKTTRADLTDDSIMAVYVPSENEEFAVDETEFPNINPTDGFIPVKQGTDFIDSSLEETETQIISTKTIEVPPESLRVGTNVTLSDSGGFLSSLAQAFDDEQTFYTQNSVFMTQDEYDAAEPGDGIIKPSRFNIVPERWQDTVPFDFLTNTTSSITFPYVTQTNLVVNSIRLRFDQPVNNVRLKIERLQDDFATWRTVWQNVQDSVWESGSGGYNFVAGENTQELPLVNLGRSLEIFRATLETTESVLPIKGVPTDLGLGPAFYPFLMILAQDWFFTDVPNDYDITQDNFGEFKTQTNINTDSVATVRTLGAERDGIDDQPDFSTVPGYRRDWGFTFTSTDVDITLESLTFKSEDAHPDVLFTVDNESAAFIEDEPAFNTFDVVVGDNTITFPQEVVIKTGETFTINLFAFDGNNDTDTGVRLRSALNTTIPFFSYRVKSIEATDIVLEAPNDGKQYTRRNEVWDENNSAFTTYVPSGDLTALNTQDAIDELETNKVDDAANVGGEAEVFRDKTGTVLNFRTLEIQDGYEVEQQADKLVFTRYKEYVEDNTLSSTTSTTFADILQNNFTVPDDGNYKLGYEVQWINARRQDQARFQVRVDGVENVDLRVREKMGGTTVTGDERYGNARSVIVNLTAGTYDIDLQHSSGTAAQASNVYYRRLFLERHD